MYLCRESGGEGHLQVSLQPQQGWHQNEDLRHVDEHRPVLKHPVKHTEMSSIIYVK